MTNNQLSYLNLQATKRNNFDTLEENKRHNKRVERLTKQANRETGRHNLVTETNQIADIQAGIEKSKIAADASKYSADTGYKVSKYTADRNAKTQTKVAKIQSRTQLRVAELNQQVQAAHDEMNKIINDDKLNNATKLQMLKNNSDQFIAQLNRDLDKYKADLSNDAKLKELENNLIIAASKTNNNGKRTILIGKALQAIKNYINKLIK